METGKEKDISPLMKNPDLLIKIAVVGPESTGKSSMAQYLARYYHTVWVPEYAREYCSGLNRDCTLQDEINMFFGQLERESKLIPYANKLLICDVTILNVKIYSEDFFSFCPEFIKEEIKKRKYDFYLLLDIDMPWEEDPLRGQPFRRPYFFDLFKKELQSINASMCVISGMGEDRYRRAVEKIEEFLNRKA